MKTSERGEIATILTLVTVVLIAGTAIVSSVFLGEKKTTGSRAAGVGNAYTCAQYGLGTRGTFYTCGGKYYYDANCTSWKEITLGIGNCCRLANQTAPISENACLSPDEWLSMTPAPASSPSSSSQPTSSSSIPSTECIDTYTDLNGGYLECVTGSRADCKPIDPPLWYGKCNNGRCCRTQSSSPASTPTSSSSSSSTPTSSLSSSSTPTSSFSSSSTPTSSISSSSTPTSSFSSSSVSTFIPTNRCVGSSESLGYFCIPLSMSGADEDEKCRNAGFPLGKSFMYSCANANEICCSGTNRTVGCRSYIEEGTTNRVCSTDGCTGSASCTMVGGTYGDCICVPPPPLPAVCDDRNSPTNKPCCMVDTSALSSQFPFSKPIDGSERYRFYCTINPLELTPTPIPEYNYSVSGTVTNTGIHIDFVQEDLKASLINTTGGGATQIKEVSVAANGTFSITGTYVGNKVKQCILRITALNGESRIVLHEESLSESSCHSTSNKTVSIDAYDGAGVDERCKRATNYPESFCEKFAVGCDTEGNNSAYFKKDRNYVCNTFIVDYYCCVPRTKKIVVNNGCTGPISLRITSPTASTQTISAGGTYVMEFYKRQTQSSTIVFSIDDTPFEREYADLSDGEVIDYSDDWCN